MSLSPFLLVSCSFLLLAFLLLLTPFLRSNQKLLIVCGSFLMTVASLAAVAAGVWSVSDDRVSRVVLPLGLPDLPFHIRLDQLSGFFLVVIGLLSSFVSLYSLGYLKGYLGLRPVTSLVVFSALFLAGMLLVVLADDAFFFLIAWEMMAASSYYLVLFEDERVENRRAAFLYLVVVCTQASVNCAGVGMVQVNSWTSCVMRSTLLASCSAPGVRQAQVTSAEAGGAVR